MMGPFQQRLMEWVMSMNPDMPSEFRDFLAARGTGPAAVAFKLVLGVVTGAVFGMIGGLLGVALFKKNTPVAPPDPAESTSCRRCGGQPADCQLPASGCQLF